MSSETDTLPLIRTKLYRPRITADLVPLPRLLEWPSLDDEESGGLPLPLFLACLTAVIRNHTPDVRIVPMVPVDHPLDLVRHRSEHGRISAGDDILERPGAMHFPVAKRCASAPMPRGDSLW